MNDYNDKTYKLEVNQDIAYSSGNLFLFKQIDFFTEVCVGSVHLTSSGDWIAVLDKDEKEDHCLEIGRFKDKQKAIKALWDNRHLIQEELL